MLVLSRQFDEKIIVEIPPSTSTTTIEVHVNDIRRDKVKLGFVAPPDCPVHREEVWRKINAEQGRQSKSLAKPPKTDAEIVREANDLARNFAKNDGWEFAEGYCFYNNESPRAKGYWGMARLAFAELRHTDIDDALNGMEG